MRASRISLKSSVSGNVLPGIRPSWCRILGVLPVLLLVPMGGSVPPAEALDPGEVEGLYDADGEVIELTHAYVHLHDNAEGILSRTPELRILLTDREVDPGTLAGMVFLPVEEMARQGEVRGLLILMDPAEPNTINVTYLVAPGEPELSLMNQSFSTTGKDLWTSLSVGEKEVSGAMEEGEPGSGAGGSAFRFSFRAPVFHEPAVTADLKGKEAAESPQADVLRARVQAMKAGDLDAIRAANSARSNAGMKAQIESMGATPEQLAAMLQQYAPEQEAMLEHIGRVVVRGDRAVLLFAAEEDGTQWSSFVMEDGVWKSDD